MKKHQKISANGTRRFRKTGGLVMLCCTQEYSWVSLCCYAVTWVGVNLGSDDAYAVVLY